LWPSKNENRSFCPGLIWGRGFTAQKFAHKNAHIPSADGESLGCYGAFVFRSRSGRCRLQAKETPEPASSFIQMQAISETPDIPLIRFLMK
jgi:hypothetical protein